MLTDGGKYDNKCIHSIIHRQQHNVDHNNRIYLCQNHKALYKTLGSGCFKEKSEIFNDNSGSCQSLDVGRQVEQN